jgi:hypothetical protein
VATVSSVTVGLQNNTDRTVYATWKWTKDNTKEYSVKWYYATGNGVWFVGSTLTTSSKQSVYTAPSNATKVKVTIKPVSKTYTITKNKKKTTVSYWTATWSTAKTYTFSTSSVPDTPSVPSVTITKYKLTAEVDCYDTKTKQIEFQVVKNDEKKVSSGKATVTKNHAAYTCNVSAGTEYKVRCRGVNGKEVSSWSEYSSDVGTIPSTPTGFTSYKATSSTSVYLSWNAVSTATSYTIEYATKKAWFGSNPENVKTQTVTTKHAEITGLDSGETWYFRLQATNSEGSSGFCDIVSVTLGKAPAAPTTWSSTSTVTIGDDVELYWVHNSEDGSSQTYAQIELTINGKKTVKTVKNSTDEDLKDKISHYTLSTTDNMEGSIIYWRVRTRGVLADYGDWSVSRTITAYSSPTIVSLMDTPSTLTSYPLSIYVMAEPDSQNVVQFSVSITADFTHGITNSDGTEKVVSRGEEIYSISLPGSGNYLDLDLNPNDVTFENNESYTVHIIAAMDSGLSAEFSFHFEAGWEDELLEPNARIGYDANKLVTYISPYCLGTNDSELLDSKGNQIKDSSSNVITTLEYDIEIVYGVKFNVFRREFDGTFTEIMSDVDTYETIIDNHPSLDLARYRIVARSEYTGKISFYDVPGVAMNVVGAVIQWNEEWSNFDSSEDDGSSSSEEDDDVLWHISTLRLPYNVDIYDNHDPDVSMINYIGREHPVSYYGTQKGESSTWSMEIDKNDVDTLYALRRLAIYQGDVYVRESSGSGYWANVKVSFSQKHKETTIPITMNVTRVEGEDIGDYL